MPAVCQPAGWSRSEAGMPPPDDIQEPVAPAADALPPRTTPTWEVELLISGVAAFAMVQLPASTLERIPFWR